MGSCWERCALALLLENWPFCTIVREQPLLKVSDGTISLKKAIIVLKMFHFGGCTHACIPWCLSMYHLYHLLAVWYILLQCSQREFLNKSIPFFHNGWVHFSFLNIFLCSCNTVYC